MIALVVAGLAVARLIRLVVDDRIPFQPVRLWLEDHSEWGDELITCPWCVSGWISFAAVAGLDYVGSVPWSVLAWFAVWWLGIAGYMLAEALARYAKS